MLKLFRLLRHYRGLVTVACLLAFAQALANLYLPRLMADIVDVGVVKRDTDAIVSIALYPRWVNLFFLQGAHLHDPHDVLKGNGNQVRYVRLDAGAAVLDTPAVRALLSEAIAFADAPFAGTGRLVIRAISKKQRPRR